MKNFEFMRPAYDQCLFRASKNIAQLYFSSLGDKTPKRVALVLASSDIGVFALWAELLPNETMNFLPVFAQDAAYTSQIGEVFQISLIHKGTAFSYQNHMYFFDGEKIFNVLIINSQALLESYVQSLGWSKNNIFAFTQIYVQGIFRCFLTYAWRIVNWDTDCYCIVPAFFCESRLFELPFINNGIDFSFECEDIQVNEVFKFKQNFWQLKNSAEIGLFIEPIGLNCSTNIIH